MQPATDPTTPINKIKLPTNKEIIYNHFQKHWVCRVVRSGFHNGSGCIPGDPHVDWGCGYRYETSLTPIQMIAFIEILNRLEDKKRKTRKKAKQAEQDLQDYQVSQA